MSNIIARRVGIVTLHQVNCQKKEPFQQNLNSKTIMKHKTSHRTTKM